MVTVNIDTNMEDAIKMNRITFWRHRNLDELFLLFLGVG
jgi:hypothetical protein